MAFWPRRRPDDLLRVVQRLEARVSGMERRILQLTERSDTMAGDVQRLQSDEQNLQGAITADNAAYSDLQGQVAALKADIAAGTDHAQLAALADQLEQSISQLQSHGQPAPQPAPAPAPAPTPPTPTPASPQAGQTATTNSAAPALGDQTITRTTNPAGGFVVPPAQETANPVGNHTPAETQPAPPPAGQSAAPQGSETPTPAAAPDQGQGPVDSGQAGT